MTAARKLKAKPKPKKRTLETDALCAASGPYDDLFEQYGALLIDYVDERPVKVWFDPWDERIPSADLTVHGFLQTSRQTRVRCDEGHWWTFEAVEDSEEE
jgi:hypothetical protein